MKQLSLLLLTIALFSGCTATKIATSAAGTAGGILLESRSFTQSVSDNKLELTLETKFYNNFEQYFQDIDIEVWKGNVLIAGVVPIEETRAEIVKFLYQFEEVESVINELDLGSSRTLAESSLDLLIASKINFSITVEKNLSIVNTLIIVRKGIVSIIGAIFSENERALMHETINSIDGVTNIRDHLEMIQVEE